MISKNIPAIGDPSCEKLKQSNEHDAEYWSARDVFALLAQGGWISSALADSLKHMVGFRNIAVHDDPTLQLPITVSIIQSHLDEFLQYSQALLLRDAVQS